MSGIQSALELKYYRNKQTRIWSIRLKNPEGKKSSLSLGVTDLEQAKKIVEDMGMDDVIRKAALVNINRRMSDRLAPMGTKRVSDSVTEWLFELATRLAPVTVVNYESVMDQWMREMKCGDLALRDITISEHIQPYLNEAGISFNTLDGRRKKVLNLFFVFCQDEGYIQKNPVKKVRVAHENIPLELKQKGIRTPFTTAEVEEMLKVTDKGGVQEDLEFHGMIFISAKCGLRISDAVCLEWHSFREAGKISYYTRKGMTKAEIITTPEIEAKIEWLKEHVSHPDTNEFVFPKWHAIYQKDLPTGPRSGKVFFGLSRFDRKKSSIKKSAGIHGKGRSFHTLRHTYVTNRQLAGIPASQIAGEVGHASVSTTAHYMHMHDEIGKAVFALKQAGKLPDTQSPDGMRWVPFTKELEALWRTLWA